MSERYADLARILADQIDDLSTATEALRVYLEQRDSAEPPALRWSQAHFRMCITFLIITLAKVQETLDGYSKDLKDFPGPIRLAYSTVLREIKRKQLIPFRNRHVVHVLEKSGTPRSVLQEGQGLVNIVGNDLQDLKDFCEWIDPGPQSTAPGVIPALAAVRRHCLALLNPAPRLSHRTLESFRALFSHFRRQPAERRHDNKA